MFAISVVTNVVMVRTYYSGLTIGFLDRIWKIWHLMFSNVFPPKVRRTSTVPDALLDLTWVSDIKGAHG
jgi:hypothetical protein